MGSTPIISTNLGKHIGKFYRINNRIFAEKVRLIDSDGKLIHDSINKEEAINLAREKQLDLVELISKAKPPVCKLMDFGKFKYDQDREERVQKAKQKKVNDIKGIRISFKEGDHDLNFKIKSAIKFLQAGNKVKIEMILKGREKAHFDLAREKLTKFIEKISEIVPVTIEGRIQRSPRGLNVIIQADKK